VSSPNLSLNRSCGPIDPRWPVRSGNSSKWFCKQSVRLQRRRTETADTSLKQHAIWAIGNRTWIVYYHTSHLTSWVRLISWQLATRLTPEIKPAQRHFYFCSYFQSLYTCHPIHSSAYLWLWLYYSLHSRIGQRSILLNPTGNSMFQVRRMVSDFKLASTDHEWPWHGSAAVLTNHPFHFTNHIAYVQRCEVL
jgi:hypothetical protein